MSDESVGLVRQIHETWSEEGPAAIGGHLVDVEGGSIARIRVFLTESQALRA